MPETRDFNAELFVKLYSKIALALGVVPGQAAPTDTDPELAEIFGGQTAPTRLNPRGNQTGPVGRSLLAIYNPGQYIPSDMKPDENPDDLYALSVLLDVVPQFSWVYKPALATVSNTYKSILDYKQVAITHQTDEQKTELKKREDYYAKYIDGYNTAADAYFDVLDEYDMAYATAVNEGTKVKRSLKEKLGRAFDAWVAAHKEGIESAVGYIAYVESLDPTSYWYKLTRKYDDGTKRTKLDSEFQPTGFSPPYKSWFGDAGWSSFTFNQKDMDNQKNSETIGAGGSLSGDFGMFTVSGDGDFSRNKTYTQMNETKLEFSCKLMRVSLDRQSWMNSLVFSGTSWRWLPGSPAQGSEISSGADVEADLYPTGTMTVVPTAAILSRDLKILGTFDNTLVETLNQQINANASVGIGPFSIAGRFNMGNDDKREKGSIASNLIEAKDVQIIALICEMLPKCPNPDSRLTWPT